MTDQPERRAPKAYRGAEITVTFDTSRCLHAAECIRGAPSVFDSRKRPWVRADGAPAEFVVDVVRRCPSGALQYVLEDGPEEPAAPVTSVARSQGGRIVVRGDMRLRIADRTVRETRCILCGCGTSGNLPYCDSTGTCSEERVRDAVDT